MQRNPPYISKRTAYFMEFLRRRIEAQVLSLSGIALGQIDFENPKGDPGLFGPDSVSWQVHGDFTSMLIGGISALLLQALHPLVWDANKVSSVQIKYHPYK